MDYQEEELIAEALANNETARDIIYEKYKYIVEFFVHKYHNLAIKLGIDMKELEQEAYYAFSDALKRYRQDKNTNLSTFLFLCISRRLKNVMRNYSSEKARLLNNTYSLDYDYDEEGYTLKDTISDDLLFEPLNKLTEKENYEELLAKIKEVLSPGEYEVFVYIINGFDAKTITLITNKNAKQIDNTIQRIKHKIRDIMTK